MRVGILLILAVSLVPMPAQAQIPVPGDAWTREDFTVTSFDGTELAASVWIPKDPTPVPAILITNGWNNRHDAATELRFAERYANQGYVVLGWTSRGWGNSGGEIELDGYAEQNDTRTMLDLLVAKGLSGDWPVSYRCVGWEFTTEGNSGLRVCDKDACPATGPSGDKPVCWTDPVVGIVGESYAGGIQFLTAQGDPRLDSLIPRITWSNLLRSLAPDDVLKVGWITELYGTGQTVSRGVPVPEQQPGDEPDEGGPSDDLTRWYAESAAANEPTDEMRHEIGWVRSLHPGKLTTPTLLIQGWGDTLFQPNEALATYHDLLARNVTTRLILYPGGHGQSLPADDPTSVFVDQQMDDWFNVTLRGKAPTLPPYPVLRFRDTEKDYVGELQWPPANTTTWRGYFAADNTLAGAPEQSVVDLVNPVLPTNCVDVPSFQSQAGSNCPYSTERTAALWAGPALEADQEVTGTPVAHLFVSSTQLSDVRLFVTLEDIAPDGSTTAVWRQATPMRITQTTGQAVNITMQTTTHTFSKGHRIGLQVATTDLSFHASREPGTVTISSSPEQPSWLDVPMVPKDEWGDDASIDPNHAPSLRITSVPAKIGCVTDEMVGGQTSCDQVHDSVVTIEVRDDLALANVSVTGARFATQGIAGAANFTATVYVRADQTITVEAVDMLGNKAKAAWTAPVIPATCPPDPAPACPKLSAVESPAVPLPLLVGLLVVAAGRMRRRSQ